jgi:site-specific DNA recombinase
VKCGNCGKSMTGQEAKSGKYAYYVCGTLIKRGRGTCETRYLSARRFEEQVLDKIQEKVLSKENLKELVRLVNEEMDVAAAEHPARIKALGDELAGNQRRLDRLYDALETGSLALDDLSPRIQRLRRRQEQVQAKIAESEAMLAERSASQLSISEVAKYVDELKGLLQDSELAQRKSLVKSFVREIVVIGGEAVMHYVLPVSGTASQDQVPVAADGGVLATVRSGGPDRVRTCDQSVMSRPLYH